MGRFIIILKIQRQLLNSKMNKLHGNISIVSGMSIIISKLPVDIDKSHFNIIIILHVDIIYLAYKGQKCATIISNEKKFTSLLPSVY